MVRVFEYRFECDISHLEEEARRYSSLGDIDELVVSGVPPCRAMHPPEWELENFGGVWPLRAFLDPDIKRDGHVRSAFGDLVAVYMHTSDISESMHSAYVHSW